jgi:hypothetical protein
MGGAVNCPHNRNKIMKQPHPRLIEPNTVRNAAGTEELFVVSAMDTPVS